MLLELFGVVALVLGSTASVNIEADANGAARTWTSMEKMSALAMSRATFLPVERAVSNWRWEAARSLDASPRSLADVIADDRLGTPRCVKLNNYWCVKRAGWAGEIAADSEGHVAFASASEGAVVAAMLLRRYYLVYNRRSAQAILSRWAPAKCGGVSAARGRGGAIRLGALTTRGIANTLRARWLASHRRGFAAPRLAQGSATLPAPKLRRSVVADRPVRLMAAPEIAVGMGEQNLPSRAPVRLAALEAPDLAPLLPGPSCVDETARIRQYALRAIEGVVASPDDDLQLFAADGTPLSSLSRLMQNMARVEIGPLAARLDLITAAIEAEARRDRETRAVAKTSGDPAR
ncbi:hypothetical protein [Methylocella tundrae]|uniref:Uncharacterized protein n=1 Tax=Methylocella tundrae TaxID=227605 RepID=A0A4V6IML9_METTU|nr:hypothetical protein [Methylocella tundrae]WPP06073.1 hypothetical protein SIN04_09825 [Methylocella tundrae]VFU08674.1 conserved protein of unknown function [Methylocella tundrae]